MAPDPRSLATSVTLAVVLFAGAGRAQADGDGDGAVTRSEEMIGLLDVRVQGVSATAGEVLTKAIADEVSKAGFLVVLPDRLREAMASTPWNSACLIGSCLVELDRHAAVSRVLQAGLVSVGANYDYVVTLIDTARGVPVAQLQRTCDVCTTDEALAATTAAAVELVLGGGRPPVVLRHRLPPPQRRARHLRRASVILAGSAVAVGLVGLAVRSGEHAQLGAGVLGVATTLAVAGGTCLVLSFDF